ncbi:MAG: aspartate kinase [Holosporaceae bacterium]|jgi:aspartate kinase|nr:aspartate kinase [Holosporaceae bacterium]
MVQKFGGTSVATLDRIKNVAALVSQTKKTHPNVVVIVSAMAGVTNKFVQYANGMNTYEGNPEYDSVVSSGELVTAGLMAMALGNAGLQARSYSSWQVPIFTDHRFGRAVIQNVEPSHLLADMENGIIPVVCGFQGISPANRVTTLGRGGSDLTAVAVAAAVNADICEIYSDVDGIYTVDPNLYPESKLLEYIGYQEMLEMASNGAKVMQEQSVAYALEKNVKIRVASSFTLCPGTIISERNSGRKVCGLAVVPRLAQIKISPKNPSDLPKLIALLAENFIYSDVIGQNSKKTSLMVDKKKALLAINLLKQCDGVTCAKQEIAQQSMAKINVVAANNSEEITKDLVKELEKHKMKPFRYSTNACSTSLIIAGDKLAETIALLHKYCELDK